MSDFPKLEIDSNNVVKIFFDEKAPEVCGILQEKDPETGEAFATREAAEAWADSILNPPPVVEVVEEEAPAIEG